MDILVHLLLFLASIGVVWFFAGLLIEAVDRVAKRFHQTGFTVAFLVLGLLTSISEISVMVNSTVNNVPQVSVGNLVGASFVILLLIVPLAAVLGNGVALRNTLSRHNLKIALLVILLPVLLVLDGSVTKSEGLICLLSYACLIYLFHRQHSSIPKVIEEVEENLLYKHSATIVDVLKISLGAIFIFLAGHLLVEETVFFAGALSVPSSIIGLVMLSVGTNVPELVIAVRAIMKRKKDIAFGDYLGSAVANTLVFGFLPFFNGKFYIEASEFVLTALLMILGLVGFYFSALSKNNISRKEGLWLVSAYGVFILIQVINIIRFSLDGV